MCTHSALRAGPLEQTFPGRGATTEKTASQETCHQHTVADGACQPGCAGRLGERLAYGVVCAPVVEKAGPGLVATLLNREIA
ncbi:hypothetical protein WG31_02585 [Acetobacter oryzifermentans]|uniref:Uncharacterized protein n=1 Tax=Acetobacter oryzifermentans TaxID=1633874 RepID=A0ABN4NSA9_9PROT|nr:hypothetical protein WG31_02585 [Acetobacter oryzifermentans]